MCLYSAASARLEVSIRNTGQDALDADTYGDTITVERVINATGGASLKIKNQFGNDVGSTRDQLIRITDHFNIDVDNPIVVMSQDASRQFLHSGGGAEVQADSNNLKPPPAFTKFDSVHRKAH